MKSAEWTLGHGHCASVPVQEQIFWLDHLPPGDEEKAAYFISSGVASSICDHRSKGNLPTKSQHRRLTTTSGWWELVPSE